jgi:hypothetical protein
MGTLVAAVSLTGILTAQAASSTQDEAIRLARETLRKELSVGDDEITVRDTRPTRWSDTSLGCPEKGIVYAPVLVEGYRVELEAFGKTFLIHVGGGRAVWCNAQPHVRRTSSDEIRASKRMYSMARDDLARLLNVPVREIKLESMLPARWPDSSLGCPRAGETYEKKESSGYVIKLVAGGKTYRYHTDPSRAVLCGD